MIRTTASASSAAMTRSKPSALVDGISVTHSTRLVRSTARGVARHFMAKRRNSTRKAANPTARRPARKARPKRAKGVGLARPKRVGTKTPPKSRKAKRPTFNPGKDSANDPRWVAPVWADGVLLGAHVSIAGGTHEAPPRARAIGATAMQMFTKMANRWADRVCEATEGALFRGVLASTRVSSTIAHDSYLINLASPDATLRRRSIESFVAE